MMIDQKQEGDIGGAEGLHADEVAGGTDVPIPSQHRCLLDREARLHVRRQHALSVGLRLVLEDVPRGHGDDTRTDPLGYQRFMGLDDQGDLAAGSPGRLAIRDLGQALGSTTLCRRSAWFHRT